MTYAEKLRDPRWQKKRLEIFDRDQFTCTSCGDNSTTLNVHHLKYSGEPWETDNNDLQTLCDDCHVVIEWREKENLPPLIALIKSKVKPVRIFASPDNIVLEYYQINGGEIIEWNFLSIPGIKLFLEKLQLNGEKSSITTIL